MAVTRDLWRIDRAGSLARLHRRAETLPDPGPGEARVAVSAIGLNFADIFACQGLYSATPTGAFVPGLEFAGIVDALGPPGDGERARETSGLSPGDAVFGMTRFGAFATALNADARLLRRSPAGWGAAEAAAFPVQALTAWYGLVELGRLSRGDVTLVHSAAGGVGLNALAILQAHHARIVATVGRPSKRDLLVERCGLAPAQVVVRDRRRFGAQLDAALAHLEARGFDLVFDAVLGPFFTPAFRRLRPEGRHVVYGAAAYMTTGSRPRYLRLAWRHLRRPRVDPLGMIDRNRSVLAFNLIWLFPRLDRLSRAFDAIGRVITRPPLVGRRFPFDAAPAALAHLQSGESVGKVVLEV